VAEKLRSALPTGARVLLGLSGGMDSVVLLDILAGIAAELRFEFQALYVNHGISPNAAQWGVFCERICRDRNVPIQVVRVNIEAHRHLGLEGAARQARYEALAAAGADFVVVAQHQDDQAETLLLQLMRGAGARGLAAMPAARGMRGTQARLLRPLLGVPRSLIEAYAHEQHLEWIEDESNADVSLKRNFLRARVLPALEEGFPGARAAIALSAANLGEASTLLDELADEDLQRLATDEGLDIAGLLSLGDARARNALRRWCESEELGWPGSARLAELLRQLAVLRPDAATDLPLGELAFRAYRGVLHIARPAPASVGCTQVWRGESVLPIPGLGGRMHFTAVEGRGISAALMQGRKVTLRSRRGGERLQLDSARPRRTLKNLFQERGIPPWHRDGLPFIYCDEELVAVPGLGEDCRWRAGPGERGWLMRWERLPD
jgi:tRNA(Ile)-lysidine synthase